MSDCVTGRRQTDCINATVVDELNKDVGNLNGQLSILKKWFYVVIALLITLSGALYNEITETQARTDKIRDENSQLKSELKDMIQEVKLQLAINNTDTAVTKERLKNLEGDIDKVTKYVLWVQEAMVDNGMVPMREKR